MCVLKGYDGCANNVSFCRDNIFGDHKPPGDDWIIFITGFIDDE